MNYIFPDNNDGSVPCPEVARPLPVGRLQVLLHLLARGPEEPRPGGWSQNSLPHVRNRLQKFDAPRPPEIRSYWAPQQDRHRQEPGGLHLYRDCHPGSEDVQHRS